MTIPHPRYNFQGDRNWRATCNICGWSEPAEDIGDAMAKRREHNDECPKKEEKVTINPSADNFMKGVPDPKPGTNQCADGKHDMPEEWDYSHNPAGSKTCRRPGCRVTHHD